MRGDASDHASRSQRRRGGCFAAGSARSQLVDAAHARGKDGSLRVVEGGHVDVYELVTLALEQRDDFGLDYELAVERHDGQLIRPRLQVQPRAELDVTRDRPVGEAEQK